MSKPRTGMILLLFLLSLIILPLAAVSPAAAEGIWSEGNNGAAATGRWPDLNEVEGKAWIVIDSQTGEVLIAANADQAVFPASTTKIMTAVLVLEADRLDQIVAASPTAVDLPYGSSKIGLIAGEEMRIRDLLAGLMLGSGNDAANVLAEALAGSVEAFAKLMNAKGAELGMTGSHFCNPSGLHDPEHVVTARDMAILAAYAMKNQQFRDLVSTLTYALPATNMHPYPGWSLLNNTNRFLQFGPTLFSTARLDHYEGIKTGSTDAAGNNLVAAAVTRSGRELISVLCGVPLKSKIGNPFIYTRTLLEAAAARVEPSTTPPAETTATTSITATTAETTALPSPTATESSGPGTETAESTATVTEGSGGPGGGSGIWLFTLNPWLAAFLVMSAALLTVSLIFGAYVGKIRRERRLTAQIRRIRRR